MKRILIVGCGDVAMRLVPLLRPRYRLFGLLRDATRHGVWRDAGVVPVAADLDDRNSLAGIAGLAQIVVHLAPPSDAGDDDIRTRNLLAALSRGTLPERFVYISTSGVYGDCAGALVSETRPVFPQTVRARRRVAAERRVRSWACRNHVSASVLRVPGIYAAERLPLERLRSGVPAISAEQDSYTNHIHADDLARIIVAAIRHARPNRIYHAVDDGQMKMGDYFDAVADACGLPRPPRIGRAEAQSVLSPALLSFINESRRLSNERMKKELNVVLSYPVVKKLLGTRLGQE